MHIRTHTEAYAHTEAHAHTFRTPTQTHAHIGMCLRAHILTG